jgi:Domain of unknown function (DUF4371)
LLKKIDKHKASKAHERAVQILLLAQSNMLEESVRKSESLFKKQHETKICETSRVFRTAYECAKSQLSFSEHTRLIQLQQCNGLKLGNVLFSYHSCENILTHIAQEMRKDLIDYIVQNDCVFAIMVDESTTVSQQQGLIVYIRTEFDGSAETYFLGLVHVEKCTAEQVYNVLLKLLIDVGLSLELLKRKLIAFCSDGASTMLGSQKGVATLIKNNINPNVRIFHCMAHRLELSVRDIAESVNAVSHFQIFLDSLYSFYSRSPKNQCEIKKNSDDLGEVFLSVGKIFDVRWSFSSFRAVRALWVNYPALIKHLENCSSDSSRNAKDKSKCLGLVKKMSSWSFVAQMAMLKDCLRVVKDLSLYFQRDTANIMKSYNKIQVAIKSLQAMKEKNGKSLSAFILQFSESETFKGVVIRYEERDKISFISTKKQFFQGMVDSIDRRFPDDGLLISATVLDEEMWPIDEDERILYGDKEVALLAKLVHLNTVDVLVDFREYKMTRKLVSPVLKNLLCKLSVLPISSAACERGFSAMNAQQTSIRNRLLMKNLENVLFVSINGMPLQMWDPTSYVLSWLKAGRHSASDKPVGRATKDVVIKHSAMIFKSR